MACELLAGNVKNNCETPGGIVEWYASSFGNVSSLTELNGSLTAITMVVTKKFFPIKIDPTTSTFTDASTGDFKGGIGSTPSATIITKGYTSSDYTFHKEIESGRIILIAKRSDGTYVMLFREFGGKALVTLDAGTGFETFNGATIGITGFEIKKSIPVAAAAVLAVLV